MSTNSTQIKLSFPEWLKLRRDIAKLTQGDIAKALGVTKQTISSWEKGNSKPSLNPSQTKQLCVILGITFDELVKGFNEETEIRIY
jgi:transcriptional regulator with XRE-family HTH domain